MLICKLSQTVEEHSEIDRKIESKNKIKGLFENLLTISDKSCQS